MFHPLPLFISLRYARSRNRGFFVSFISVVSVVGICLGVAALITIISVMNGLGNELRNRLLSLAAHATFTAAPAQLRDWPNLAEQIRSNPEVVGVAPFIELQGMLGRGRDLRPAMVRGVEPRVEPQVSEVARHMLGGTLDSLVAGEQGIVLGVGLALALDVRMGDELTLLVTVRAEPGAGAFAGLDIQPRVVNFTVVGIFEVGAQEHDNVLAMIHLQDAAAIAGTGGAPTGLRLKFRDIFAAPGRAAQIGAALGEQIRVSDWTKDNATYFRAIALEKTMMSIILTLTVGVAAFNIVATLVMVVNEKRTGIAILRTLGMTPRAVMSIFMSQGVLIGWFGALLGLALGLALAFNVGTIVPVLERMLNMHIFDPTVYYITEVPAEVQWPQVIGITVTALVLTVLATIYPSRRGAATQPAEALRYE